MRRPSIALIAALSVLCGGGIASAQDMTFSPDEAEHAPDAAASPDPNAAEAYRVRPVRRRCTGDETPFVNTA